MNTNQTPLNPDALAQAKAAGVDCRINGGSTEDVIECAVEAYLAVAQPEVNSAEELDALPQETVIRSVFFGVVRERLDSGWLATGADEFESTDEIAGRDHVVLHRPEAKS